MSRGAVSGGAQIINLQTDILPARGGTSADDVPLRSSKPVGEESAYIDSSLLLRPFFHPVRRTALLAIPADPRRQLDTSMISIKPEACPTLRTITADEIPAAFFEPVDPKAREQALVIVNDVKANGVEGLLKYACKLGDLPEGERKYSVSKEELKAAYDASDPELQACGACIVCVRP